MTRGSLSAEYANTSGPITTTEESPRSSLFGKRCKPGPTENAAEEFVYYATVVEVAP